MANINNKKDIFLKIIMYTLFTLVIGWTIFLIINSCLDSSTSGEVSTSFADKIATIINNTGGATSENPTPIINNSNKQVFTSNIRKVFGHFLAYGLLGILLSLGLKILIIEYHLDNFNKQKLPIIIFSILYGLLISIITEVIQMNTPGRSGNILDMLLNFSGYLLGVSIIFLICLFIYISKKNKNNNSINK